MAGEIVFFIAVVVLWVHGFHAVTRPDKLLSFLGAYLPEQQEFQQRQDEMESDFLMYLEQFRHDHQDVEPNMPLARRTKGFLDALDSRENLDKDYRLVQQRIDIKLKSRWWKFVLTIAPAWSECKLCMSSIWTVFFAGVFSAINSFALNYYALIVFSPILVAGATAIIQSLQPIQRDEQ